MGERVRTVMRALCLSQAQLADHLEVPYDTVRGWSSGRADPSPENRQLVITFIRQHADRLVAAADELSEDAET